MVDIDAYTMAMQELLLSGEIGLGRCSVSTVYRWAREINKRLAREQASWCVKADIPGRSLKAVPYEGPSDPKGGRT